MQRGHNFQRDQIPDTVYVDAAGAIWKRIDVRINNGYRTCHLNGERSYMAHRLVWSWFNGDIPEGMVIRHLDGDPLNNRPDNLALGTQGENIKDQFRHGNRNWKGEGHPRSKLTEAKVIEIRRRHADGGVDHPTLAAEFGVSPRTICGVVNREIWKHVA